MSDDLSFSLEGIGAVDRRKAVRKPLRTAAVVDIGGVRHVARVIDISRNGIAVSMDRNPPLRAECTVSFWLPSGGKGHHVIWQGRIVDVVLARADGFRIGIALETLSPEDALLVDCFLGL